MSPYRLCAQVNSTMHHTHNWLLGLMLDSRTGGVCVADPFGLTKSFMITHTHTHNVVLSSWGPTILFYSILFSLTKAQEVGGTLIGEDRHLVMARVE